VNGEEEAVGDAEHRDDDAHGQQRVEQVDDLVGRAVVRFAPVVARRARMAEPEPEAAR
jgi:hypothetical protein